MESKEKIHRTISFSVRLEPQVRQGLDEIAERLGIKPHTVAAYAIGEYVAKQRAQWAALNELNRMMVNELGQVMDRNLSLITSEEIQKAFSDD